MRIRTAARIGAVAALIIGLALTIAGPASAVPRQNYAYSQTWESWDNTIAACIHVEVSGTVSVVRVSTGRPHVYQDLQVSNPTMSVAAWSSCRTQAARGAVSARLSQEFSATQCSLNPSFGYPWQISFSPSCNSNVGLVNAVEYGGGSYWAQNNATTVTWHGTTGAKNSCVDAQFRPTVTVNIGGSLYSDTLTFSNRYCVPRL